MRKKILATILALFALPVSVMAAPVVYTAAASFGDYFAFGCTLCLGLASVLACKTIGCYYNSCFYYCG